MKPIMTRKINLSIVRLAMTSVGLAAFSATTEQAERSEYRPMAVTLSLSENNK